MTWSASRLEEGCAPKLAAEKMAALGAELFGHWLAGSWRSLPPQILFTLL